LSLFSRETGISAFRASLVLASQAAYGALTFVVFVVVAIIHGTFRLLF